MSVRTRQAYFEALYNGKSMMASLDGCATDFSFEENAEGEGDSVSISIADPTKAWLTALFPQKGDSLSAGINCVGYDGSMFCGTFVIDGISFSGEPTVLKIGAISTPENEEFRTRERTQVWENVTLQNIAAEIAERTGVALVYDAPEIKIKAIEQSKKNDCAFLSELCKSYGLSLKVYNNKIIIFDRIERKKRPAAYTVMLAECTSWDFATELVGSYTGGEIAYTSGDSEEDIAYKMGTPGRWLKVNERADSLADAQKKLESALDEANHDITTLDLSMPGQPAMYPAQCLQFVGLGAHVDGKYYINSVSHDVSGSGYTSKLKLSKVVLIGG